MSDKFAVVTGTSSGIGRGVAQRLLEAGWQVWGYARRKTDIAHAAYRHTLLDLGDLAALQRHFEGEFARAVKLSAYARVGLVNNSAVQGTTQPLWKMPAEELLADFAVNTVAPIWLMGFFLRQRGAATLRIVNLSSAAATGAVAGWTAYCSTKAALRMAGQVLVKEAEQYDEAQARMRDAAVAIYDPSSVDTAMQAHLRTLARDQFPLLGRFQHLHEKGRLVDPGVPAEEILALLEGDGQPQLIEKRRGA